VLSKRAHESSGKSARKTGALNEEICGTGVNWSRVCVKWRRNFPQQFSRQTRNWFSLHVQLRLLSFCRRRPALERRPTAPSNWFINPKSESPLLVPISIYRRRRSIVNAVPSISLLSPSHFTPQTRGIQWQVAGPYRLGNVTRKSAPKPLGLPCQNNCSVWGTHLMFIKCQLSIRNSCFSEYMTACLLRYLNESVCSENWFVCVTDIAPRLCLAWTKWISLYNFYACSNAYIYFSSF